MKQAREVALDALTACERQGAWSDGYLKKAIGGAKLDGRDAALATRLCFGVLQNRMLLDFYLSKLCATPLHKLEASIRNLLRGSLSAFVSEPGAGSRRRQRGGVPWPKEGQKSQGRRAGQRGAPAA